MEAIINGCDGTDYETGKRALLVDVYVGVQLSKYLTAHNDVFLQVSLLFVGLSFVGWILFIAGCSTYIEE